VVGAVVADIVLDIMRRRALIDGDDPTVRHHMQNLWRWKCGLPEDEPQPTANRLAAPEYVREREGGYLDAFAELLLARLVMGAYRYGYIRAPGKPQYDRCTAMRARLGEFERTGNAELLVDVANLALLEFYESAHPLLHFAERGEGDHVWVMP
jgi:hypothetical protein